MGKEGRGPWVAVGLVAIVVVGTGLLTYGLGPTRTHGTQSTPRALPHAQELLKLPYEEFKQKWFEVTDGMTDAEKERFAKSFVGEAVEWNGLVASATEPKDGLVACCGWAVPFPQKGYVIQVRMDKDSYWSEMALCGLPQDTATRLEKGQTIRFRGMVSLVRWRGRHVGFVLRDAEKLISNQPAIGCPNTALPRTP